LRRQSSHDDFIGRCRAVRAANPTLDLLRDSPVDRLNVKGVFLTANALDFNCQHSQNCPVYGVCIAFAGDFGDISGVLQEEEPPLPGPLLHFVEERE
jgi:hypothetical protein